MKYIDADRLRAEIKRLKKHSEESKKEWISEGYNQNAFAEDCRIKSFDKLISFLDTLPEQPASEELEEEIKRYRKEEMPVVLESDLNDIARHFAEWGAEHLKK